MVVDWFPQVLKNFRRPNQARSRARRFSITTNLHCCPAAESLESRLLLTVDLQPYQAPGMTDKLVVTNLDASSPSDPLTIGRLYYSADFAVINAGTSASSGTISSTISVDGVLRVNGAYPNPLPVGSYLPYSNAKVNTGFLSSGSHLFEFKNDPANTIAESNEANNDYSRNINVGLPSISTSLSIPAMDILAAQDSDWLTVAGTLAAYDSQIYSFTLDTASGLFLDFDSRDIASPLSSTLNAVMALYDSTGQLITTNDDGFDFRGYTTPSTIITAGFGNGNAQQLGLRDPAIYADLAAGNYYVAVAGLSGTAGNFQLRALADGTYSATIPQLSSLPGAADTLYLDFDGHSATDSWGTYVAAPYSMDASSSTYSPAERLAIRNLWRTTAEDFSPFNINITTVNPGSFNDGQALRMVMTNSSPTIVGQPSTILGVAPLNAFGTNGANNNTAFTFMQGIEYAGGYSAGHNGRIMAGSLELGNVVSHEFGHALGLKHYRGSATSSIAGTASILPQAIMGTPSNGIMRSLWASGTAYLDSSGLSAQDDLAVISNGTNTFGYRADDHGNTTALATVLSSSAGVYAATGVIHQAADVDYFQVTLSGSATISVDVDNYVGNLDAKLSLYDSAGVLVGSPVDPANFDASMTVNLPLGVYYIAVASHGDYGKLGQYSLKVLHSTPLNTNPTLNAGGNPTLDAILTNVADANNPGTLVSDIIARMSPGGGITDPDSGALFGIALNGTSGAATGTWQFSINGGSTWQNLGTVNNDAARLLAADSDTRLRYVPNAGFSGEVKISFVAWDQTAGTNGGLGVTKFRTGTSPFSANYEYASLFVNNAAPVLNAAGAPTLDAILQNVADANNPGTLVTDIIARMSPGGGISDANPGALQGIAINGLGNTATGTWEFTINNGTNWTSIGTTGNGNARLLAADPNTRIRYRPNSGFHGEAKLAFVAWDRTTGSNGGVASVNSRGGTTPYSLAYDYASLFVNNSAPVLTPSNSASLNSITQNVPDASNTGTLVSEILASLPPGSISDANPSALQGIAINALGNLSSGTWQYSTNGGSTWSAVGTTGNSNARLLAADANTRIRFVPNANFTGTVKFAFVLWDQTAGLNGGIANTGTRGNTTPFSLNFDYASLTVTP